MRLWEASDCIVQGSRKKKKEAMAQGAVGYKAQTGAREGERNNVQCNATIKEKRTIMIIVSYVMKSIKTLETVT